MRNDTYIRSAVAGAVLCGGQARRMTGYPEQKPLVPIAGAPMWRWVAHSMAADCERLIVNLRPEQEVLAASFIDNRIDLVWDGVGAMESNDYLATPPVKTDATGSEGPLAGILAALAWAEHNGYSHLAFAPCDTPMLPAGWVRRLWEAAQAEDAEVVTVLTARTQPTIALWQTTLRARLERAVQSGERKIDRFTAETRAVVAAFPKPEWHRFSNVNTPEDLASTKDWAQENPPLPDISTLRYERPAFYADIVPPSGLQIRGLSPCEIDGLCDQFIANLPADYTLNVMAYGSLMWNPGFPYCDRTRVVLPHHRREFALWSLTFRGHPIAPGLVLALVELAKSEHEAAPYPPCYAECLRVSPEDTHAVLRYLWHREMSHDSYIPTHIPFVASTDEGGHTEMGLAFVLNPEHPQAAMGLAAEQRAQVIASARGTRGENIEYARRTVETLRDAGVACPETEAVLQRCEEILQQ